MTISLGFTRVPAAGLLANPTTYPSWRNIYNVAGAGPRVLQLRFRFGPVAYGSVVLFQRALSTDAGDGRVIWINPSDALNTDTGQGIPYVFCVDGPTRIEAVSSVAENPIILDIATVDGALGVSRTPVVGLGSSTAAAVYTNTSGGMERVSVQAFPRAGASILAFGVYEAGQTPDSAKLIGRSRALAQAESRDNTQVMDMQYLPPGWSVVSFHTGTVDFSIYKVL